MERTIPNFKCATCGNCETDFHNDLEVRKTTAFCLRFKENTLLEQVNLKCWTSIENQYYKKLHIDDLKRDLAIKHKTKAIAKIKGIDLTNQLILF
jgi:hypothetical protein